MGKHTIVILTEMCNRVNTKFEDIDFYEDRWFMKHSWNKEEEEDFIKWMTKYLTENKKAQREIMETPVKRNIEKVAKFFVWNYGWKTNQNRSNYGNTNISNTKFIMDRSCHYTCRTMLFHLGSKAGTR